MIAYRYIKKPVKEPVFGKLIPRKRKTLHLFSLGFLIIGLILLANAVLPILFYQLKIKNKFDQKVLGSYGRIISLNSSKETINKYQHPSSWFPTAPKLPPRPTKITHYTISIPKLKIKEATVEIGGDDLAKSLVHYSGTALPGQNGNVVIFGHSILPQFYNPQNYKTIFSTLPTLEKGDEVLVDFDGVLYRYQVISLVEVKPTDISILTQYYDSQYLTLVTCVPPGTYLRRLAVRAKLA